MNCLSKMLMLFALGCTLLAGCGDPPPPPKGKLEIQTEPAGATVLSGGKEVGETPKQFNTAPGKYRFRVEKPGYHPEWVDAVVEANKTNTVTLQLEVQGSPVLITSEPAGAAVIFQGKKAGVTPLLLPAMLPGDYTAQLTAPHCAETTIRWSVQDVRPMEVAAKLISNIGILALDTNPAGARLTLNGKEIGTAPFQRELQVGTYQVRAEKDGFHPVEMEFAVRSGAKTEEVIQLASEPGEFVLTSSPAGALVRINDKPVGSTPLHLKDLSAGILDVELLLQGYDPYRRQMEMAPASKLEHHARLQRSTGSIMLQVRPANTKVLLDGKEVAVTRNAAGSSTTLPIELHDIAPGIHKITAIHVSGAEEQMYVRVGKGQITRPKVLDVWVPNVRVKFKKNGMEEIGMLYSETETTILYGPERGIRVEFNKSDFEYIKPLTESATQTQGEKK